MFKSTSHRTHGWTSAKVKTAPRLCATPRKALFHSTSLMSLPLSGLAFPFCCMYSPTAGPSMCLDAFIVALNQACDGELGYVPTLNLQLVCVQLCVACRSSATLRVRVDDDTPHTLLTAAHSPPPASLIRSPTSSRAALGATRVPVVRAHTVVWARSAPTLERRNQGMDLLEGARSLQLGKAFAGSLGSVAWPENIVKLELGGRFEWAAEPSKPSEHPKPLSWPPNLRHLAFGQYFNKPVDGVTWPMSLETLTFGNWFNQPIVGVEWPVSLERLSLGQWFNQPISGITLPPSLRCLTFEGDFNQAIVGVAWPGSLASLTLGHSFDQPVENVFWPASLRELTFGRRFNRPIARAVWPASLRRLTFGYCFNQPIDEAAWPSSLSRLEFGHDFNQPVAAVRWPTFLEYLAFGDNFNQPVAAMAWPALLRHLAFGYHFNQPVGSVVWPPRLRHIAFGKKFDRSGLAGVEWPTLLRPLGEAFGEYHPPPSRAPSRRCSDPGVHGLMTTAVHDNEWNPSPTPSGALSRLCRGSKVYNLQTTAMHRNKCTPNLPPSCSVEGRAYGLKAAAKHDNECNPTPSPSRAVEGGRSVSRLDLSRAVKTPPPPPRPLLLPPASLSMSLPLSSPLSLSRRAKRTKSGGRFLKSLRRKRLILRRVFRPRFTRLLVDRLLGQGETDRVPVG